MKFALAAFGLTVAALTTPAFAADEAAPMAAAFTIDTPIEALMADERAKAVAPFSQGLITDDVLAKIAADLAAIK